MTSRLALIATPWRIVIALILAAPILAEYMFRAAWDGNGDILFATAVYLAAALLFAVAAPTSPVLAAPATAGQGALGGVRPRWRFLAAAILLFTLGLVVGARDIHAWILVPIWFGSIGFWIVAWISGSISPGLTRRQVALLLLVLTIASVARLYGLESHQASHIDEFVTPEISLRRTDTDFFGKEGVPIFAMQSNDIGSMLLLGSYRRRWLYEIAGLSITTMRLPSAIHGIIDVGLIFFLGRQLFGFRAGIFAASILATLTMHLAFSRHGEITIEGPFPWITTSLLLAIAFTRRSVRFMAAAGLSLSLAMYVYLSARPSLAYVVVFLVLAAIDPRLRGRWLAWGSAAFLVGLLIGAGPLLVTLYREPSVFFYFSQITSWLWIAIGEFQKTGQIAALRPLWEHFYRAFLAYNVVPSADHHYYPGRGLFTIIPAGLLYAALALVCLRVTDWRHRMLALWFWAPTIALSAMSDHPPPIHRTQPAVLAAVLLIGLGGDRLVAAWERVSRFGGRAALAAVSTLVALSMAQEAWFYFGDYATRDMDPWQGSIARFVLSTDEGQPLMIMPGPQGARLALTFATNLGRRNSTELLYRPVDDLADLSLSPRDTIYIINSVMTPWLPLYRDAYPGGTETRLLTSDQRITDPLLWTTYRVSPDIAHRQVGLQMRIRDARDRTTTVNVPTVAIPDAIPGDFVYPLSVEWRGWVRGERGVGDRVAFASTGNTETRLRIGDETINLGGTIAGNRAAVSLSLGGQPVYASARIETPADRIGITWEPVRDAGQQSFPLGRASIWPGPPRVLVEWLASDGATVHRREYDVTMADHAVGLRASGDWLRPLLVRWSGTLLVERAGAYEFELQGDQQGRLLIDGRQVWPPYSDWRRPRDLRREEIAVTTRLTAGEHSLVVERHHTAGGLMTLYWRVPGGEQVVIPPRSLAPLSDWP
ncbi:MAG: hypothetical protein EPO26_05725 [Chloroflexota bacterium]|nr:MAG: hypothetical protein EPO26_05725 [Chloroflexota bacterium]